MNSVRFPNVQIHPTALIEDGVQIGEESRIWDHVHIRRGARLGRKCIVGEKSYIAYDVQVGDLVKLNAFVYICAGVTIEDGVMIAAHTVFTNDKYPRATLPDFSDLRASDPTQETLHTTVRRGVTIGANATIGAGIELGEFAMIGMGSIVTDNIPPYALAFGCPARLKGYVCACGYPLGASTLTAGKNKLRCPRCGNEYQCDHGAVSPLSSR